MTDLRMPAGTVTFLLTDVEGSTRLWESAPDAAAGMLQRQRDLIGDAVAAHGGLRPQEQGEGDSVVAVFESASAALAAALDAQRSLAAEQWPDHPVLRVRMGLHTGEARLRDEHNYAGVALHRCARLRDIGYGGQTLVSSATVAVVADAVPEDATLIDLGLHRLRDLSSPERVFQLAHPALAAEFPPLRSLDAVPNNLPQQLTSFVGREDELATVEKLVARHRLVTLTGAGGCGKTRLAVQATAELADRWADGAWWVDLSPVIDPDLVPGMCAATIGLLVDPAAGPLRSLQGHLHDRRLLLCLDNCEHVVESSAHVVEAILRSCPGVTVLATSREPLHLPGEIAWRVPEMAEAEAARLFIERAGRMSPGFSAEGGNAAAVRDVCARLDGMPLAVELAAAWIGVLTPAQIVAGLDDRFRLLADGPREVPARQQTLRASMDWSYDLLAADERAVLGRLAVFSGAFSLDAATAVCPSPGTSVLRTLRRLVDTSLLVRGERDGEARYRLLETIRQYAGDRLDEAGETPSARDRHLDHFLDVAEAAEPHLELADQDVWLARLEADHDNLRSALDWGLSKRDPERGRRLAAALARLWFVHGRAGEAIEYLRRAVATDPDDRSALQARLLAATGLVATAAGQLELTVAAAREGLEVAERIGDRRAQARCLVCQAYVQLYLDLDAARELSRAAQRHAQAVGDDFTADMGLVVEALVLRNQDRHDEARPLLAEAFERSRRRGDRMLAAYARTGQAMSAVLTGDVPLARRRATEAVELAEPLGDYFTFGQATSILAWVTAVGGDVAGAQRLMGRIVGSVADAGPDVDVPAMALTVGELHLWAGELDDAVEALRRAVGYGEPLTESLRVARALPRLAAALRRVGPVDEASAAAARGIELAQRLGLPNVLADALDEQARLEFADVPDEAERLHLEALAVRVWHGLRGLWPDSLDALAAIAASTGRAPEAVRTLAASDAARAKMGRPRAPVDQPDHDAAVTALRAVLGDERFTAAWKEGAALSLDDVVDDVTRAHGLRPSPLAR